MPDLDIGKFYKIKHPTTLLSFGLQMYMPYGIKPTAKEYQHCQQEVLATLTGVSVIVGDILVYSVWILERQLLHTMIIISFTSWNGARKDIQQKQDKATSDSNTMHGSPLNISRYQDPEKLRAIHQMLKSTNTNNCSNSYDLSTV